MSRLTRWLRNGRRPAMPGASRLRQWSPPNGAFSESIEVGRHLLEPLITVETKVSLEERRALFEHVAALWKDLGETEPYESVLYSPIFRVSHIKEHLSGFYRSADYEMQLIRAFFGRNNKPLSEVRSVLEIGCGVGRVTARLAAQFQQVVAVDVSPNHLALARKHTEELAHKNIQFVQVRRPEDFENLPRCDLFFSTIVLQHDPPPLIAWILSTLLSRLQPGGYCLFQVPTYRSGYEYSSTRYFRLIEGGNPDEGYEYNATRYFDTATAAIEMHVLPQNQVYALFRDHGIDLLEVGEDRATGARYQSMIFFGQKTASGTRESATNAA